MYIRGLLGFQLGIIERKKGIEAQKNKNGTEKRKTHNHNNHKK